MLDQTGNTLVFDAFFTASGLGATGLTVTVDVWNPAGSRVVTGGTATEIGDGLYTYTFSGATSTAGNYRAVFKTSGTADQPQVAALWIAGKAWVQNLDTAISGVAAAVWGVTGRTLTGFNFQVTVASNNDKSGYTLATTPPTSSAIASAVVAAMAGAPVGSVASSVVLASNGLDLVTVETGLNARQALAIHSALAGGVLSGAGTGTIVVKGAGVATTRITATTDSSGNRSSVTLNLPS